MRESEKQVVLGALMLALAGVAAVLGLLVLTQCGPGPAVIVVPSARPEPGTPADCARACAHLRSLGCEEGKPTPGGASCEQVCDNVQQSGATALDLGCVVDAGTCARANGCGYGAEP